MGFRCGNGPSSVQLYNPDVFRLQDRNPFMSSYSKSFSRVPNMATPSSQNLAAPFDIRPFTPPGTTSLRQVGFLDLKHRSSKAGQSSSNLMKSRSDAHFSVRHAEAAKLMKTRSEAWNQPAASRIGPQFPQKLRQALQTGPVLDETKVPEVSKLSPELELGSEHYLDYKPRAIRRAAMELLANPEIEHVANDIFQTHDKNKNGTLEFDELQHVLKAMYKRLGLPSPGSALTKKVLEKFDWNKDELLSFKEFFAMLLSLLRNIAYDRSGITGRDYFVGKREGSVWDIWKKMKKLGSGTFGSAFLCKHKLTDEVRVIKAVRKSRVKVPVEEIEREILIMKQVDHPHVVRLFQWFEDSNTIFLVMEGLMGGTLKDIIMEFQRKRLGVKEAWSREILRQSLQAMAYCHSLRLVHKDLKDENLMLLKKDPNYEEPFVVIIDLGIAEMFSSADPHSSQVGGTPLTMAPEVWQGQFDFKCDVWSLGCVLFELLSGGMPFQAKDLNPRAWIKLHKRGPNWATVKTSPSSKSLCQAMLTFDKQKRPSMEDCLHTEWFNAKPSEMRTVSPSQFKELSEFCNRTALKRTLLLEIASRLPMRNAGGIVDTFQSFDVDKDATLSLAELRGVFAEMDIRDDATIARIFNTLDVDNDGMLSFSEFAAGLLILFKDILEERLRALFDRHDSNGDGALDVGEAQAFLATSASLLTKEANANSLALLTEILAVGQTNIRFEELRDKLLGPSRPLQPLVHDATEVTEV